MRRDAGVVFERFTDRARRVVVLSQEEARLLNHNYIGTEHILLGLISEGEGVAAKALEMLDVSLDAARVSVHEIIGHGGQAPTGHIPFTPRAKKVLELALREALQLGHNYIGTEHILLGLIREGTGVGAQVLVKLGATLERVRAQVIQVLSGFGGQMHQASLPAVTLPSVAVATPGPLLRQGNACSFCGRDLWEVDRYVLAARASICNECVDRAREALHAAVDDRTVTMPPRAAGPLPIDADTLAAISDAFVAAFDGVDAGSYEDARQARLLARAGARYGFTARTVVEKVRLVTEDRAEVRFAFVLGGPHSTSIPLEGEAVRQGGMWKVATETVAQLLRTAGVDPDPGT